MAVSISQSGSLTIVIDSNFTVNFSASTDTPIFNDADPPIRIGTATMVSLTVSVAYKETDPITLQSRVSENSGVSSASVTGIYTQDTFPQNSMTYIPRGSNTSESTPTVLNNFDIDNVDNIVPPSSIELLAISGADSNIRETTITVTGRDSEGVTKTSNYTLEIENNLGKIKNYIKRVYP